MTNKYFILKFKYLGGGLLGVFRPTREFFTHLETSPLLKKEHSWSLSSEGSLHLL